MGNSSVYGSFSIAMLNNQRVASKHVDYTCQVRFTWFHSFDFLSSHLPGCNQPAKQQGGLDLVI